MFYNVPKSLESKAQIIKDIIEKIKKDFDTECYEVIKKEKAEQQERLNNRKYVTTIKQKGEWSYLEMMAQNPVPNATDNVKESVMFQVINNVLILHCSGPNTTIHFEACNMLYWTIQIDHKYIRIPYWPYPIKS